MSRKLLRIVIGLFFILSCEVLNSGSTIKEHVHFRIYVPEIINHKLHMKTVLIHLPHPKKMTKPKTEAPSNYYKESHHEDWSSWRTYGYHGDHYDQTNDNRIMPENPRDHTSNDILKKKSRKKVNPPLHRHRDSYLPVSQDDDKSNHLKGEQGDMMGYSYPPQYAVQEDTKEDTKDLDHNKVEPYVHAYEEGYYRGGESVQGQTYSKDSTKFHEDKHEGGDHSIEEYEKSRQKTHAGRYFADDSDDYLSNSDKYEADKRVSSRMFV